VALTTASRFKRAGFYAFVLFGFGCDDLGCGGANTISTVYRDGYFSEGFSMVLGADGNPLIAHNDGDP